MNIYLSFEVQLDIENVNKNKLPLIKILVKKILFFLLPVANPDFELQIDNVKTWILEFNDKHSIPIREIGLNNQGKVILKMPFNSNYGYWTDNLLKFYDFQNEFNAKIIDKENFLILWNSFE